MANFFSLGGGSSSQQQQQEISNSHRTNNNNSVPTEISPESWFLYRNDHNQEIPTTYKCFELWQSGTTPQHQPEQHQQQHQFRHPIYPLQDLYSTAVGFGVGTSRSGFDISSGDQKRDYTVSDRPSTFMTKILDPVESLLKGGIRIICR
ncbi:hypothetical protein RND71_019475 [Anisodus tanguticus]|uniref:Uncharacterized protein n=1 Tax=Anisodus tanguticus TaxID=243964 RepID=A0AAE1RZ27_9SOLA|nr:hypothetical protein RND71_019475 [Anisodus tanguticus]